MKRLPAKIPVMISLVLVSACGGGTSGGVGGGVGSGGGDGHENTPPPNESPSVTVVFPPHDGLVTAKDFLAVRGHASDTDGIVEGVTVNGVEAESVDGFANWAATVPLKDGSNTLEIRVRDDGEGKSTGTVVVTRAESPFPFFPAVISIDDSTGRIFIADSAGLQIAEVSPESGNVINALAGPNIGEGEKILNPRGLAPDLANNRIFVMNSRDQDTAIVSVDLSTLERTEISGPHRGEGPSFMLDESSGAPESVEFDGMHTIYAASLHHLYIVDVVSGNRQSISIKDYDARAYIRGIQLDADKLYLASHLGSVFVFDTTTAEFSTLADIGDGNGSLPKYLRGIALNRTSGVLYVASADGLVGSRGDSVTAIVAINLADGSRDLVFFDSDENPQAEELNNIAVSPGDGSLMIADGSSHAIKRLDTETGSMSEVVKLDYRRGAGPHLSTTTYFTGSPVEGVLVLETNGEIYQVKPETGDRVLVAKLHDPDDGEEPAEALTPDVMVLDDSAKSLWLAEVDGQGDHDHLYRFNLQNQSLEAVGFQVPDGVSLNLTTGMRISPDGKRVFLRGNWTFNGKAGVTDLLEVNIETQQVRVLAGATETGEGIGSGPAITDPTTPIQYPNDGMLYVVNGMNEIIRINPNTLERELVGIPAGFESSEITLFVTDKKFIIKGYDTGSSQMKLAFWHPGEDPEVFYGQTPPRAVPPLGQSARIVANDIESGLMLLHQASQLHTSFIMDSKTGEYLLISH